MTKSKKEANTKIDTHKPILNHLKPIETLLFHFSKLLFSPNPSSPAFPYSTSLHSLPSAPASGIPSSPRRMVPKSKQCAPVTPRGEGLWMKTDGKICLLEKMKKITPKGPKKERPFKKISKTRLAKVGF